MENSITNTRKLYLDIAKGFLIVFVVFGHIESPIKNFFYLFHVPAFFVVSGLVFNERKYALDYKLFLKSRFFHLYLPYSLYNVFFVLFHNCLSSFGMLNEASVYAYSDVVKKILRSLVFPAEELAGALWFIPVLLLAQSLFLVFRKVLSDKEYLGIGILSIIIAILGFIQSKYNVFHPGIGLVFTCFPFFVIGACFSAYVEKLCTQKILYFICPIVLVFEYVIGVRYNIASYPDFISFYVLTTFGTITVLLFSSKIERYIPLFGKIFSLIGRHSFAIMALHFACFKICTLVLSIISPEYRRLLPILAGGGGSLFLDFLPYIFFGVVIPVCISVSFAELHLCVRHGLEKFNTRKTIFHDE